ncbi:MAG: hypothetical protein CVT48_04120 [Thermoplasmata archaeon HGW-Thermoplasmata-1]|nr:MAG: hypothetical protein CVT48_04120 [Thermoplasmata archaeon HGW-Thermoplasmata-1]
MALRPNASIDEALEYYRIGWKDDGRMVLNPAPLPEIPKEGDDSFDGAGDGKSVPGFGTALVCTSLFAVVALTLFTKKMRKMR